MKYQTRYQDPFLNHLAISVNESVLIFSKEVRITQLNY